MLIFTGGLTLLGVVIGATRERTPLANPFARWDSFEDCERDAARHGARDPAAYCGAIRRRAEHG